MAGGDPGDRGDVAEQPVLAECGGRDGLPLSGNTLTLNLAMTFKPAYAGAKNIYLYAVDISGSNSGWQLRGHVDGGVASGTPPAVSVTPSSGSGTSQTFALQYSDTAGAANLQQAWVYFSATLGNPASQSCMLYYNAATNQINLLNDDGMAWQAATPGSCGDVAEQPVLAERGGHDGGPSGNTLTLNLAMTFQAAFAGAKNIYLRAMDISGTTSGVAATGRLDGGGQLRARRPRSR